MESLNYSREIGQTIDYIEEHLMDPLTAEQIAAYAGYSLYHFFAGCSASLRTCRSWNMCAPEDCHGLP
ncbi:hypothetical protein ACFSQ7_37635 [Paenibacillus rhizoplanae]